MKFRLQFVTTSGSVYEWSWMTGDLYKVESDGSREHVLRHEDYQPRIRPGERAFFEGRRWTGDKWRQGYEVSTSPVVSTTDVPEPGYMVGASA